MHPNSCICCFSKTGILLSLTNQSSHMDGKTLWDYLNSVLGFYVLQHNINEYICLRCSKALQVAYHFIEMVKESKGSNKYDKNNNKQPENNLTFLGVSLAKGIPGIAIDNQGKEISPSTLNPPFEGNELEIQSDKSVIIMPQQVVPLNLSNCFKILIQEANKAGTSDAGSSEINYDFHCTICKKIFENKNTFTEHNRQEHKQIIPLKCKLCSFYTCYRESLLKHYKIHHKLNNMELDLYETKKVPHLAPKNPDFEITYLCLRCDFKTPQENAIDYHLMEEHFIEQDKDLFIKKIFKCPSCYRSFNDLKSARIHYTRYHSCSPKINSSSVHKKFACEKCGKLFDLKSGLFLHKRVCEKRNAVNCNFCKLLFSSVLKYEHHLQNKHAVAIRHECEICGKTFSCAEYLTVHRKRHNERYYQCDMCTKNYINNAELKVHKQRIHNHKDLGFKCNICGKVYANASLLRNHENEQHTKRYFKCIECDYISNSSYAVKVHQYQHTGKPYKCPICPKEFVFRKDLRQHAVRHHSVSITQEDMAQMFRISHGYTSRFDAFSHQNNSLEISEIKELELEGELKEFGLTLQDIMKDLFDNEMNNKLH